MPTQVSWYDPTQTIIHKQISGEWEINEWRQAAQNASCMAAEVNHPVSVIVEYAPDVDMNRIPDGLMRFLHQVPKLPIVTETNINRVIVVGLNGKLALADRIFQRLHRPKKGVRVPTFDDALAIAQSGKESSDQPSR